MSDHRNTVLPPLPPLPTGPANGPGNGPANGPANGPGNGPANGPANGPGNGPANAPPQGWAQGGANRPARQGGIGLGGQRQPPPRQNLGPGRGAIGPRPAVEDWKQAAMRRLGLQSKVAAQTQILTAATATKTTLFTGPVGADVTRLAGGPPDNNYAAFVQSLTAIKASAQKTPQMRQQLEADARAFVDSNRTIKPMERNTHVGRSNAVKQALSDLHRFDACEQIEAFGPPPWESRIAMQVASLQASIDFESLPIGEQTASMNDATSKNPTMWVKSANPVGGKQKTFIFKPQQDDVGDRAETVREAVTARAADLLNGALGLSIAMPETHIVTVERERMPAEAKDVLDLKALQKQGPLTGSLQTFSAAQGDVKGMTRDQMAAIDPKSVHHIAVLDIVTLNSDRHGGNLLTTGGNAPSLVPIDHGLAFPEVTRELRSKMGGYQNALLKLPAAHQPFDAETQQSIAKLDADAFLGVLKRETETVEAAHPSTAGTLKDESLNSAKVSIEFLKHAAPELTPAEIQVAIGRYSLELFETKMDKNAFAALATRIVTETKADRAGIAEFFTMPNDQRQMVLETVRQNGWTEEASHFGGGFDGAFSGNLTALMSVYHSGALKPAAPQPTAGASQRPGAAATLASIKQQFPATKLDSPANQDSAINAWERFRQFGGTKDAVLAECMRAGVLPGSLNPARDNVVMFVRMAAPALAVKQAAAQLPPPTLLNTLKMRVDYLGKLLPMTPQPVDPDLVQTVGDVRSILDIAARSARPMAESRISDFLKMVEGAINTALEQALGRIRRMVAAAKALPNPLSDADADSYLGGAVESNKIALAYTELVKHDATLANVM